jgi:AcrR family transcriptional regulator
MELVRAAKEPGPLRDAIIDAALELGRDNGEEGITMRGVAGKLGISPTALYQHFENKAAILQELRTRGLAQLYRASLKGLASEDVRDAILETSRAYVKFARENQWLYLLLFESNELPTEALGEEQLASVRAQEMEIVQHARATFSRLAQRAGQEVPEFMFYWWMGLHGLCSLVLRSHVRPDNPLTPVTDLDAFIERTLQRHVAVLCADVGSETPSAVE